MVFTRLELIVVEFQEWIESLIGIFFWAMVMIFAAAVFLLVGSTFICGAYVQSYRGHIGIDALAGVLPSGLNHARKVLADLATVVFCAFFSWKSWTLLAEAIAEGQTTTSSWGPPLWIPYSAMAIGMSLVGLQAALQLAARVLGDSR